MTTPIEHFLLLGPKKFPSELKYETFSNNSFEVGLIDSFPKIECLPDYLEHINLWCFPDGYQVLDSYRNVINGGEGAKSRSGKPAPGIREDMANFCKINNFILTDSEYMKRYCSALIFYEKYDLIDTYPGFNHSTKSLIMDRDIVFCPKVLCLISHSSLLDLHAQILSFFFTNLFRPKHFQYMPSSQPPQISIPRALCNQYKDFQRNFGKERGESMFFEKTNENQNLCVLNENSLEFLSECELFEFYLSFFYFCLPTSSPPEDFSVNVEGLRGPALKYHISKDQSLYEGNYKVLFERLHLNNVLKLVKFLLLEKSIIIFSSKPNEIIAVTETLLFLINPLKWACIYAPVLPISMIQILQAVIPYLVGMHSKHKETVLSSMDLTDKVIVDLDEDSIICNQDFIFLPKSAVDRITHKLEKPLKRLKRSEIPQSALFETAFHIRAAFADFMLGLINNYTPYFLFSRDYNDKAVVSSEIFDQPGYIKIFKEEEREFISEVSSKTMMFHRFLEDSYKILYFQDYLKKDLIPIGLEDTLFFLNHLKKLLKTLGRGSKGGQFEGVLDLESLAHLQRLIDLDKDLKLQMAMQNFEKPKMVKTMPFFVKYYCQNNMNLEVEPMRGQNGFAILRGFQEQRIMQLVTIQQKVLHPQVSLMKENTCLEDDLAEFNTINLPSKPMQFPAKNSEPNEEKKGLIEAILLKEMENCMAIDKKPRRKTIFAEERPQQKPLDNLDYEAVLQNHNKPLTLKKAVSEQPQVKVSLDFSKSKENKENITKKGFQQYNKKPNNKMEEEGTKRVPVLTINNGEKDHPHEENQEFSIFSYLISDMLREEDNKLAFFPNKPNKIPQLKRHLTTQEPSSNDYKDHPSKNDSFNPNKSLWISNKDPSNNMNEKDISTIPNKGLQTNKIPLSLNKSSLSSNNNIQDPTTNKLPYTLNKSSINSHHDSSNSNKNSQNSHKDQSNSSNSIKEPSSISMRPFLKVPPENAPKQPKTPDIRNKDDIDRTRELVSIASKPLEKIINSQRKLESGMQKQTAVTPKKSELIGFRGFIKEEKKALQESTTNTLNVEAYDYNSRLIKKRSFMN